MVRAVTAREEISSAKRTPTNANIVEAIERMHDELSGGGSAQRHPVLDSVAPSSAPRP